jgi:ELWxxDGT repeat protein
VLRILLAAATAGLALAPRAGLEPQAGSAAAASAVPHEPAEFTSLGDRVLFSATTAAEGRELWRTDGTAAGTVLVADLVPGPTGSDPANLVARGGRVFFSAGDGVHRRLWVSDGTAAGTAPTALFPDEDLLDFSLLGAVAGVLSVVTSRSELWQSDGTAPAVRVFSRAERCGGSACGFAVLRAHGGALYAVSYAKTGANELWRLDGPGREEKLLEGFGRFVGEVPGGLIFTGEAGPLWIADRDGARELAAVDAQFGASGDSAELGGALLFAGRDAGGVELWRTDGTEPGTRRILELAPGSDGGEPFDLVRAGGLVFFVARDGAGQALWATDGTAQGTVRLLGGVETFARPVALGASVLLGAETGGAPGLWRSDGTEAGTIVLARFAGQVPWLYAAGDAVYFAGDAGDGPVPWRTDGTPEGTRPVVEPGGAEPSGSGSTVGEGCGAGSPGAASAIWLALISAAAGARPGARRRGAARVRTASTARARRRDRRTPRSPRPTRRSAGPAAARAGATSAPARRGTGAPTCPASGRRRRSPGTRRPPGSARGPRWRSGRR